MSARRERASRAAPISLALLIACSAGPNPDDVGSRIPPDRTAGSGAGQGASAAGAAGSEMPMHQDPPPVSTEPDVEAILKGRCATFSRPSQLLPSNLLFVLDRSASMACNPPPVIDSASCEADPVRTRDDLPTKWEITRRALSNAIEKLPSDTVVGLSYFSNNNACGVNSRPSVPLSALDPRQVSALRASLAAVQPDGATPLVGAAVLAYRHLHEQALAAEIHGSKYVVLITDGEQSDTCSDAKLCSDAADCTRLLVSDEVPKAAGPGVRINSFVIGVPGSEPSREVLSQIAMAGGTAPADCKVEEGNCHFDMTRTPDFEQALPDALNEIAGRALNCEIELPQPNTGTVELERVNVLYTPSEGEGPEVIRQDNRKACDEGADGWQYTKGTPTKIQLCGETCTRVLADRGGQLDVVLGCAVVDVQ